MATVIGLVTLWPNSAEVSAVASQSASAAQGQTLERGEVLGITEGCEGAEADLGGHCLTFSVGMRSGPDSGSMIQVPVRGALASAGIQVGDNIELSATAIPPAQDPAQQEGSSERNYKVSATSYGVSGVFRGLPLLVLAVVFMVVVVWVGRIRGLLALVALGVSAFLLLAFILPALVSGSPGVPVALVGSSAIMFVILFFVHGFTMRTTAALVGTLCGILIMAGISLIAVHTTRLSGLGDESAGFLSAVATQIDFRGLLTCAIIIAGLGILNDVTITQASAVWELRAAAPAMPRSEVYARAMRIGRDHIASTVYTVFFSYVGASLSVLLLLYLYDRPVLSLLTREDIAVEIVRTFCGSIGLVLAVPITTWVAAMFTPPGRDEAHVPWKAGAPSF
ncbi:YibE/F family protein [Leucobacter insecticola]|uniref:YibE/F family protein n=1 Tax=Leucobacter insecticola TaxID=2714934 RepID=A0A6G8FKY0_9MICO|nr:YibE/F family protein [Leucobacter insecticola]QIM17140.1 YibE/F family protein [Leucobacter insecticola]